MTAIGLYSNGRTHSIFTPYLDDELVRNTFIEAFGEAPSRILIIQNGKHEPQLVKVIELLAKE